MVEQPPVGLRCDAPRVRDKLSPHRRVWQCRYSEIAVDVSEQEARLVYHPKNGVESGLFADPRKNPLPGTAQVLAHGGELVGTWIRRKEHGDALKRGENVRISDFTDQLSVPVVAMPVHGALNLGQRQPRVRQLTAEANVRAAARRRAGHPDAGAGVHGGDRSAEQAAEE